MDNGSTIGATAVNSFTDLDRQLAAFKDRLQTAQNDATKHPDDLRGATQQFEALFLSYMFKVMRSTVGESDTEGSNLGKDIYTEMFDNEIASNISRTQSMGIGDLLYRQLESLQERRNIQTAAPEDPQPESSIVPDAAPAGDGLHGVRPVTVSSPFGMRIDPFDGVSRFHNGVDLAAPAGMPFKTVEAGTVVYAGPLGSYGNTVVVEHANGDRTLYAHASSVLVHGGDTLEAEQVIGTVGRSGRATGPHLHFEVRRNGQSIDPDPLLAARSLFADGKS